MEAPRNILAPTDFSEMSNGSAAYAAKLAIAMNSRLHLHHVVHESETAHPLRELDDAEKEGKEKLAAILMAEEDVARERDREGAPPSALPSTRGSAILDCRATR